MFPRLPWPLQCKKKNQENRTKQSYSFSQFDILSQGTLRDRTGMGRWVSERKMNGEGGEGEGNGRIRVGEGDGRGGVILLNICK